MARRDERETAGLSLAELLVAVAVLPCWLGWLLAVAGAGWPSSSWKRQRACCWPGWTRAGRRPGGWAVHAPSP